jgi:hypothetical protein
MQVLIKLVAHKSRQQQQQQQQRDVLATFVVLCQWHFTTMQLGRGHPVSNRKHTSVAVRQLSLPSIGVVRSG